VDVGFVGLGRMGIGMARNLVKAGHAVHAWNRSPDAGKDVTGLRRVASPRDAFDADVVFTMLSDDAAIREVLLDADVLRHVRAGAVHVVASTISVAFSDELRAAHEAAGVGYVAAPVFGRPDVADAGQLNIVAAGAIAALDRTQPLFDAIGKRTWRVGSDPKQANAAKIAGNMMIAMAIEAMAEAVVLTSAHGVAPEAFFEIVLGTLFAGRIYENYSGKIVNGDFEAGFRMQLGLKDLRLATEAAATSGKGLPMLDAVRGRMTEAVAAGMGDRDWSAIADFTVRGGG
jgi:3-hydroxyisobutyrate dehydrogenase-like beta-hydroxyacid dehydrogenase